MHFKDTFKILIVDDDDAHRLLEKEILTQQQHQVFEAANGEQALEILKQQEFDAVLLDKRMPEMDGDQLCYKIRNELQLPLLPIVMVTGSYEKNELVKSLNAGANDFIHKPFNATELLARLTSAAKSKRITDQLDNMETMMFALARMIEAKDDNTGDHCTRLSNTAVAFGKNLGLADWELSALRRGGVLHDIGKLGIPDNILLKQGPLDEKEWEIMKTHTTIGYHICANLKSMRDTAPIILNHHEKWDGSGYPNGLSGDDIPLLAQVFQLVDIYDALAYQRPYKPAISQDDAIAIIRNETEKGWRNPHLVEPFIQFLKKQSENSEFTQKFEHDLGEEIFDTITQSVKT